MPADTNLIPVSELFSRTLSLYFGRWKTLVALMGVRLLLQLSLLTLGTLGVLLLLFANGIDASQIQELAAKLQTASTFKDLSPFPDSLILPTILGLLFLVSIGICMECWLYGALYYAAVNTESTVKSALSAGFSYFIPFGWALSLVGFFILLGTCLLILPGILFAVWYLFTPYVLFQGNQRGMAALKTSKQLASGYILPILIRSLALLVILLGLLVLAWGIPKLMGLNVPFLSQIYSLFSIPFGILYQYLLYEDLRRVKS
ncbi:MAG: hypothetical protein HY400_00850 [Elusimicrobia bacterium]|nr:hypothetical protein [Elusimicrobiota bacterium]